MHSDNALDLTQDRSEPWPIPLPIPCVLNVPIR